MALSVQNEQKEHLKLLAGQPEAVFDNILAQISSGELLNAAKPDSTDDSTLSALALTKLLVDTKKSRLAKRDFVIQVRKQTDLTADAVEKLWEFLENDSSLENLVSTDEYRFRDLEWRLEAKVASRFLHSQPANPKILMKLHLDREKSLSHRLVLSETDVESTKKVLVMQSSPNNLSHIIEQLESAKTAVKIKKVTQVQK